MARVDPIPDQYGALIAQLVVSPAYAAINFYRRAFDAQELYRQYDAELGRIVHCELLVGLSRFILYDAYPENGLHPPTILGGTSVTLMLYVADVDGTFHASLTAAATPLMAPEDQFWGVRSATILDPFGHRWLLASRIEDLSPSEIIERAAAAPAAQRTPFAGRR